MDGGRGRHSSQDSSSRSVSYALLMLLVADPMDSTRTPALRGLISAFGVHAFRGFFAIREARSLPPEAASRTSRAGSTGSNKS